jgi:uncharacterized protein YcbX
MKEGDLVGSIARLWTFPVKSMKGEQILDVEVTRNGLTGDRGYALSDVETGKIVSAKSVRLYPGMFGCSASFLRRPKSGQELPPVRIALPDGRSVTSDSPNVDAFLSDFMLRDVTLVQQAPDDFTIDMYHPDIPGADPAGHRDTVLEQKVGSAYWEDAGLSSPVPHGSFLDLFPVTILTTATVDHLNSLQPGSAFDERRFRMNFIVETDQTGFVENDWVGREVIIGDSLRLRVDLPDPRCVMTTLAQDELPNDTEILRALVMHNRIQVGDDGKFPCAGVYATVQTPGHVRMGDQIRLL